MIHALNDSETERRYLPHVLVMANVTGALIAAGFAVAALIAPEAIAGGTVTSLVQLYAAAYAVRAIPLAGALTVGLVRHMPATIVIPALLVSGLAQVGDAAIGIVAGQPGMVFGGGVLALTHLLSAFVLRQGSARRSGRRGRLDEGLP